jgi:hypothetical protein
MKSRRVKLVKTASINLRVKFAPVNRDGFLGVCYEVLAARSG